MGELIHRSNEARVIIRPSKSGSIENYVLIPIEGEGLVAIKQEILVDAKK
ncbi:MAG: hypothetical protein HY930_02270 [Euryarchaeota archaeon]|nr:hypothetical protein [Euryarchaeota archaeon]